MIRRRVKEIIDDFLEANRTYKRLMLIEDKILQLEKYLNITYEKTPEDAYLYPKYKKIIKKEE